MDNWRRGAGVFEALSLDLLGGLTISSDITTIRKWMANIEAKIQRIESKKAWEDSVSCKFKERLKNVARAIDNRLELSQIECNGVFSNFCRRCKDLVHELDMEASPNTAIEAGMRGLQFKSDVMSKTVAFYNDSELSKSEFYDLGMAFEWLDSILVRIPLFKCYE